MAKAVSFQLEHKNGSMISAGTKGGFTTTTTTKLATDGPKIATPAEWFPGQKLLMRFSAVALGKGWLMIAENATISTALSKLTLGLYAKSGLTIYFSYLLD